MGILDWKVGEVGGGFKKLSGGARLHYPLIFLPYFGGSHKGFGVTDVV